MEGKTNVWDAEGNILKQFQNGDEVDEWIAEQEYEVMATTYNDGDKNIVVMA